MSVAELPPPPAEEAPPAPQEEAKVYAPTPTNTAIRDVCKHCMRPVFDAEIDGMVIWRHWDPRVDMPQNPAFCVADLYVPPPVDWGHLDVRGKSSFEVTQGPSKVRNGWSGGGVAS